MDRPIPLVILALAEDVTVGRDFPILREAALSLATPQHRNVGTVGGNLCQRPRCWYYRDPRIPCRKKGGFNCFAYRGRNKYHAIFGPGGCFIVFPSDLAPALISLGAAAVLGTAKGDRVLPLEEFYILPSVDVRKENVLEKGQFLKEVRVSASKPGQRGAYVKLKERGTWDFALVSAAVTGVVTGEIFSEISIVMGDEEPAALIAHVRICGGRGRVTSLVYPTSKTAALFAQAKIRMREGRSQEKVYDFGVFDVSKNGVGILVGKELFSWLERIEIGDRLQGVELSAPWTIVRVDGTVRHKSKMRRGKYSGFQLLGIELDGRLESYV